MCHDRIYLFGSEVIGEVSQLKAEHKGPCGFRVSDGFQQINWVGTVLHFDARVLVNRTHQVVFPVARGLWKVVFPGNRGGVGDSVCCL